MTDPSLDENEKHELTQQLMCARRTVRDAKQSADPDREAAAHQAVDEAKQALGERGPVWWKDGAPDLNRHMAKNTPYADWFESLPPKSAKRGERSTSLSKAVSKGSRKMNPNVGNQADALFAQRYNNGKLPVK
jgi:hypothetical protein